MVMINRATKEITLKIVYYGPGLCGKTTNLERIFSAANPERRGKLLTVATETDRTLFFDFLPMELGTIRGMKVRVQLYTVPGQVFYDATRRIVLRGSDGVVFVADSQAAMMDANHESVENLKQNLRLNNLDPETIPLVFQYNKQDLQDLSPAEDLEENLNWRRVPSFLSVATTGQGVNETLKKIIEEVIRDLHRKEEALRIAGGSQMPARPAPEIFVAPKPEAKHSSSEPSAPVEPEEDLAPPAERTAVADPRAEEPVAADSAGDSDSGSGEIVTVPVEHEDEISGEDLEILDLEAVDGDLEASGPVSAPVLDASPAPQASAAETLLPPVEREAIAMEPIEPAVSPLSGVPRPEPTQATVAEPPIGSRGGASEEDLGAIRAELQSLALALASLTRRAEALAEQIDDLLGRQA
ncbi:MAG: ADP-ribosylation factor-like protein [Acidobacteriota bacterium]